MMEGSAHPSSSILRLNPDTPTNNWLLHPTGHDLLRPVPVTEEYDRSRWELGELEKRGEDLLYLEGEQGPGTKVGEHFGEDPERDERTDDKE